MRVRKIHYGEEITLELLDDEGEPVEAVAGFLPQMRARGYSPNTLSAYAHDLLYLYRFLRREGPGCEDFTPARSLDFLEYLREIPARGAARRLTPVLTTTDGEGATTRLAASTVNRILAAVSSFYEYLIVSGRFSDTENPLRKTEDLAAARVPARDRPFLSLTVRQRPVRRVVRVRTAERMPRPMGDEQVAELLGSLRKLRDRAMFLLMLQGGLRPGEVLNLHLEDIQYGRRRVVVRHRTEHPKGVRTKSRTERVVDLHEPEALAAVSEYVMRERPADTEAALSARDGGLRFTFDPKLVPQVQEMSGIGGLRSISVTDRSPLRDGTHELRASGTHPRASSRGPPSPIALTICRICYEHETCDRLQAARRRAIRGGQLPPKRLGHHGAHLGV
jgi:integrase